MLSAEDAGRYFYMVSLIMTVGTIVRLGVDNLTLKTIPEIKNSIENKSIYISACVLLIVILTVLVIPFLYFLSIEKIECYILIISIIPFACVNFFSIYYQSIGDVKRGLLYSSVIPQLLTLLFFFLFYLLEVGENVVICYVLGYMFIFVFLIFKFPLKFVRVCFGDIKNIVERATPFMVVSIIGILNANYPIFIISNKLPIENAAYYAIALKLATINVFVLSAVNSVIAPKFSEYYNNNNIIELSKIAKNTTRIMVLLSVPIFLLIFIFSSEILEIFGSEYDNEITVYCLKILALSQVINVSTGASSYLLQMTGFGKEYAKLFTINTLLSAICSYFMSIYFGLIGVVISIGIGIVALNVFSFFMVKQKLKIWMI